MSTCGRCDETHAEVAELTAERDALLVRRDELLAAMVRLTRDVPYEEEKQSNATLIAEVGTLRSEVKRLTAERDEALSNARGNGLIISKVNDAIGRAGIHCAITFWEAIDQIAAERERLRVEVQGLQRRAGDLATTRIRERRLKDAMREIQALVRDKDGIRNGLRPTAAKRVLDLAFVEGTDHAG